LVARGLTIVLLVLGLTGAGGGATADEVEPDPAARARVVRQALQDARAFRAQGRHDAAVRAVRRGLAAEPDAADLHRMLARLLDEQGRPDEATPHRERADALDPPEPPPPDTPLAVPSKGVLVLLLAPGGDGEPPLRRAAAWPEGVVAETLERRLALRLPEARVVHAAGDTIAGTREWLAQRDPRVALSLRIERAFCAETLKDGPFSLVWLRVAAAAPGTPTPPNRVVRQLVDHTPPGPGCERQATARALEQALTLPAVQPLLASPASGAPWTRTHLRALFPEIGARLAREVERGRARLAVGDLAGADAAFGRAEEIDPDDPEVRAYRAEVDASLAVLRAVGADGEADPARLDARTSPAQRRAVEARLAEERRRRDDLLAALAVLEEDRTPPASDQARAAYAPDGSVLAYYYFSAAREIPVLREEDTNGDGAPDRWILYEGGARREVWEDGRGAGRPDVRLVFAEGGDPLERIEFDPEGSGHPRRVFLYADGALSAEARDTTGDGVLDRTDRFDERGQLRLREEDVDGDGAVDLRSFYRDGRLERREVTSPEHAPE
jgi:tetratricopeptide (TPR) repeat protein